MILNVIAFKNEKIDAFTTPQFTDVEPDKAAVQLARSMKLTPDKATPYQNLTMWFLGTFDDQNGFYKGNDPKMLLDCRTIWKGLKDELLSKTEELEEKTEHN